MNWFVLILVGVLFQLGLFFLVKRNLKDEKDFEKNLNNDYHKSKKEENDIDSEVIVK